MTGVTFLLFLSTVMLVSLIAGSMLISRHRQRETELEKRLQRINFSEANASGSTAKKPHLNWFSQKSTVFFVQRIFGLRPTKMADYPLQWYLVVAAAFIAARGVCVLLCLFFPGPLLLAWPVIAIALCRAIFSAFDRRRTSVLFEQFPDALSTIVRCVRVGIPVQEALRVVSRDIAEPTAREFRGLADRVAIGTSIEVALHEVADRCQLPEYKFFAAALALQSKTGGPLAQTLDTLADVIRKRVAMRARGHALASEARTSTIILGVLPILAGIIIWALQPSYMNILFFTAGGKKILLCAAVFLMTGLICMRKIVRANLS